MPTLGMKGKAVLVWSHFPCFSLYSFTVTRHVYMSLLAGVFVLESANCRPQMDAWNSMQAPQHEIGKVFLAGRGRYGLRLVRNMMWCMIDTPLTLEIRIISFHFGLCLSFYSCVIRRAMENLSLIHIEVSLTEGMPVEWWRGVYWKWQDDY